MSTLTKSAACSVVFATLVAGCLLPVGCGGGNPPPPTTFAIGGTVTKLAGTNGGLVLQDGTGVTLPVSANGSFAFASAVPSGTAYTVTISAQPSNPAQTCAVVNGSGTVESDVTNITVDCGHNEWTWMSGAPTINLQSTYGTMGVPAPGNTPGGRQYAATWTDKSGNLWLFGGYGHDSVGTLLPMNDLWKFSGGEWTWVSGSNLGGQNGVYGTQGMAETANLPGARFEAASWTDASGDFWLFGGNGFDAVGNESPMNDIWKYSGGMWTWIGGSRIGLQQGVYGTLGLAGPSNTPGGRNAMALWVDASGSVWIFGGIGYDESNPINGELSDLWKYSGGQWTWMGGPKIKQQYGVYGTQGVAAPGNIPGSRLGAESWMDASGNFWLLGGYGLTSSGSLCESSDQWKYASGEWTWIAGPQACYQPGVYGTRGVAAAGNLPGARQYGVTWTDKEGNAWLFGGNGIDAAGNGGFLNDLWKFSSGQWTWVGGSEVVNQTSVYGALGTPAPGNGPGARFFLSPWQDANGNFWLFGGYGVGTGGLGNLNDFWMYEP
jgi:N-acetylneuraminic acid mutarotase